MPKEGLDKTISVRLSEELLEALTNRTVVENKDRAELIREAITNYLGLPKDSIEQRLDILHRRAVITEKRLTAIEQIIEDVTNVVKIELNNNS